MMDHWTTLDIFWSHPVPHAVQDGASSTATLVEELSKERARLLDILLSEDVPIWALINFLDEGEQP
jgi:hypothetical protein